MKRGFCLQPETRLDESEMDVKGYPLLNYDSRSTNITLHVPEDYVLQLTGVEASFASVITIISRRCGRRRSRCGQRRGRGPTPQISEALI